MANFRNLDEATFENSKDYIADFSEVEMKYPQVGGRGLKYWKFGNIAITLLEVKSFFFSIYKGETFLLAIVKEKIGLFDDTSALL